jgi:hypothetical protein
MELLDSERNGDLLYALYSLLMFLPQCHAFQCLKDRLACIPNAATQSRTNRCERRIVNRLENGKVIKTLLFSISTKLPKSKSAPSQRDQGRN